MKIGIPYIGNYVIPLKAILWELDLELIEIKPGDDTLKNVKEHAKELCETKQRMKACQIEAINKGINVLIQVGSCVEGCNNGITSAVIENTMVGQLEVLNLRLSKLQWLQEIWKLAQKGKWWRLLKGLHLGWYKLKILEELEKSYLAYGSLMKEHEKRHYKWLLRELDLRNELPELKELQWESSVLWSLINERSKVRKRAALLGDFNFLTSSSAESVVQQLHQAGFLVERSLTAATWLKNEVLLRRLGVDTEEEICSLAKEYLRGDDNEKDRLMIDLKPYFIGWTLDYAKAGFESVVVLLPENCGNGLGQVLQEVGLKRGIEVFVINKHFITTELTVVNDLWEELFRAELREMQKTPSESLNSSAILW